MSKEAALGGRGIGGKKGGLFVILFDSSALFGREDVSSRFDLMSSEGLENCIARGNRCQ